METGEGGFIKQVDGYNSGEVKIAYDTNSIHAMVTSEWIQMARECNNELHVNVRWVIHPLLKPTLAMSDE